MATSSYNTSAHDTSAHDVPGGREPKRRRVDVDVDDAAQGCLLGSIDQGTTSTRFLIFNTKGDLIAGHQMDFDNLYPHSG